MTGSQRSELEKLFATSGFADFRWIKPSKIPTARWVRMKCVFGCPEYGHNASCPPNTPSVAECRNLLDEYTSAALFHFSKTLSPGDDVGKWTRELNISLSKLETQVFTQNFPKVFVLFVDSCNLCATCAGSREACRNNYRSRPTVEALAIDVYRTASDAGYPIRVCSDRSQEMNRYAILLVE